VRHGVLRRIGDEDNNKQVRYSDGIVNLMT
jgi:hypothetical protein